MNLFDKVWRKDLLRKFSNYGITGRVFSIIKSFLTGWSLKVIFNGQSSGALVVNAGDHQGSLLGPTRFLIYINDPLKNIVRSFLNI